jgi:uncharacterized membrane protein YfcA
MLIELGIYLVSGAVVGFFAGLLGIGGGLILVPILTSVFAYYLNTPHLVHLAIGTSLATILITAISSVKAHQKYQAIRRDLFKKLAVGIFVGGFLGAWIAQFMSASLLSKTFAILELLIALRMITNFQPPATRNMPGYGGSFVAGSLIGTVSTLVGVGGGAINIPYMACHNIKMQQAIATSAALGLPVAIAGTIGFMWTGWDAINLPEYTTGYIYWPAFLGIVVTSYFTAPIGAKLTHKLPVKNLKKIFAVLLILLAIKMFLF